jgi:hypothetical protein
VFLELRIPNELWARFSDLRIVKELVEHRLRSFGCEPIPRYFCHTYGEAHMCCI